MAFSVKMSRRNSATEFLFANTLIGRVWSGENGKLVTLLLISTGMYPRSKLVFIILNIRGLGGSACRFIQRAEIISPSCCNAALVEIGSTYIRLFPGFISHDFFIVTQIRPLATLHLANNQRFKSTVKTEGARMKRRAEAGSTTKRHKGGGTCTSFIHLTCTFRALPVAIVC